MEHPYITHEINQIHQAEIREFAATQRLVHSLTAPQKGVISRLITHFRRTQPAAEKQAVLTTQELRALKVVG